MYIRNRSVVWLLMFSCLFGHWAIAGNGNTFDITMQQTVRTVTSSDTLVYTIDWEDEDGVYISPQPVSFIVRTDKSTDRRNFKLICKVTTDDYFPVDSFVFSIKPKLSGLIRQKISFTPPTSGFYRISIYDERGTKRNLVQKINIGYDPEQIISLPDIPPDFAEFWERTRFELDEVRPRYKMTLLENKCSENKEMYHIEMYSFGNVKIEGYYSVPKKPGKHPAIIRYMGYAANPRFPDTNVWPDFCEFILSVRGQGIQKSVNPYGDWIVYGLSDKNTYYYRGAYMDLIRGVDFLESRPEIDPEKIFAEGGSQGGAFTLAVCALDKRIRAAAPRIPFLSDFRDYFRICPWPRSVFEEYLERHPDENWEKIYDVLSYFDIKNLAGRITCPIIMGVGLQDETCPPHTNFAGYNQIHSEKKYYVYPNQKHSVDDSWWSVREAFFREKLSTEK